MGEISFSFKDYSVERIGRVTDEWEKTQWFRNVLQKTDCLVLIQLLTRNFCRRSGSHSPKEHTGTENYQNNICNSMYVPLYTHLKNNHQSIQSEK